LLVGMITQSLFIIATDSLGQAGVEGNWISDGITNKNSDPLLISGSDTGPLGTESVQVVEEEVVEEEVDDSEIRLYDVFF